MAQSPSKEISPFPVATNTFATVILGWFQVPSVTNADGSPTLSNLPFIDGREVWEEVLGTEAQERTSPVDSGVLEEFLNINLPLCLPDVLEKLPIQFLRLAPQFKGVH